MTYPMSFLTAVSQVIADEGGYVDNSDDAGGPYEVGHQPELRTQISILKI